MKAADFIVEYLIKQGITDVFGYPGGMVTHLMESFRRYGERICAHNCCHEQGAAFEACGYAQVKGTPGAAYATSGPGAVNLLTGICNAWFDSLPVIFITGQVNRNESCLGMGIRQRGFQETDIVSMAEKVTKFAVRVDDPEALPVLMHKAWQASMSGRKGPVLLDIPMDIFRADISADDTVFEDDIPESASSADIAGACGLFMNSSRPCILAGAALKNDKCRAVLRRLADLFNIPVVTSMVAIDLLPHDHRCNFGFIGAYGGRTANFIAAKADCVLSLGSRLDIRQVGASRSGFAPVARLIRVDIDAAELEYSVRDDEIDVCADAADVLDYLTNCAAAANPAWSGWMKVCGEIRDSLAGLDDQDTDECMRNVSRFIPGGTVITADVGQNQVWTAQSFLNKEGQKILFSGGMGAMGYSLPAAIGACIAAGKRLTVSINGDGGIQMNIQELELAAREHLPLKIIVFNNHALGMIRHFQEMYFESNYTLTTEESGYSAPDFEKIAAAYGLKYYFYDSASGIDGSFMEDDEPALVELDINYPTYVKPKLRFGQPNQDQEPLIDRKLYEYLMNL